MKYLIATLVALALALTGYASWAHQKALQAAVIIDRQSGTIRLQKEALDAQEQAAKRLSAVASLQSAQRDERERRLRASITAQQAAIAVAPEWAAVPLPAPVADWVREH